MSSILEQFIHYLFGETEPHRIELSIHPDNKPFIRVAEKLGFLKEGLHRECAYNSASQNFEDRLIYAPIGKD